MARVVSLVVLVAAGCSTGSNLRAESLSAPPAQVSTSRVVEAPSPSVAAVAGNTDRRHAADPVGLDPDRTAVLAVHRAFWDAYIPPDSEVMSPRWDALGAIAEPSVVTFYRDQFERDVAQAGGLTLSIDLVFEVTTVVVREAAATVTGCAQHTLSARSRQDDSPVLESDERLRYLMTLNRSGSTWLVHNVELAEACPS